MYNCVVSAAYDRYSLTGRDAEIEDARRNFFVGHCIKLLTGEHPGQHGVL